MSKKILFTASTMSHIENFHLPYLEEFKRRGWEVKAIALPVSKRFFSIKNLRAINYTRKILKEESFDVISSHATLAGIVTRMAVMLTGSLRKSMKIFHTAHGYLFHDDKGLKKWAYILPERLCGTATDVLMVMNHEDLVIAKKYRLCKDNNRIYYINGMGIDLSRFQPRQATLEQKKAFGIDENDFVFVYAAEFSRRKNHELLLSSFASAIAKLEEVTSKRLKLVLAGDGVLFDEMKRLARNLGINDRVVFLGYKKNMEELYSCCDVAVSTSKIEGLPFNVMEAMACGLPVIASDIKGHQELITHNENGFLFESGNQNQLVEQTIEIYNNPTCRSRFSNAGIIKVRSFSITEVLPSIINIYNSELQ